jgi:uncharacterized protein
MTNKKKDNVVIIFAKKPEIGNVKTRIAEGTSDQFAYELAEACFLDLLNKINNSDYYDLIVGVDSLNDLSWFQNNFSLDGIVMPVIKRKNHKEIQSLKFENIFSVLLNKSGHNYKKAILIPMDVPFISAEELIASFARLDQKNFVFGPEINGGVYLIGIKSPYKKGLFKNIRWSTSRSFNDLIKNCRDNSMFSLKLKNDLNIPEDILQLKDEIYHNCPVLYRFLEKNNYYVSSKNRYINFDDLPICIPIVSNIVEKIDNNKKVEILIQTRYKPTIDPKNTGKLEIPSGLIKRYELAHDAAVRETKEEAGIMVEISKSYITINNNKKNKEKVVTYKPFYCSQQLIGDRSYLSIVFISRYVKGQLIENPQESRNPEWYSLAKLKKIIDKNPQEFFGLSLAIIKEYLKFKKIN